MRSFYQLALLALPFVGRGACEEQKPTSPTIYANAHEAFQDLLNALPEESLHVALNSLAHFKDGVFESDRHGVERVHNENPPLATKLIVAAVQDLKKRQSNSTQTSAPPPNQPESSEAPPPTSDAPPPPPENTEPPPVVIPVPITQTDSNGQQTVVSSALYSQATASVEVVTTRTNENGETEVATETKPAVIFESTDSNGQVHTTASAVDFAPTAGQVLTTTDSQGSTFLTTYTPAGGKVSSVKLITTTGADGQPSVITSYTFVDPAAATPTNGQPDATGSQPGRPGLQTNVAHKNKAMEAAMLGGAVGGAFALWV